MPALAVPIHLDVEMTNKENPTRWEGETEDGKRITVHYRFWKLIVELDDRLTFVATIPPDHPGTTRLTMTNAGLKQALHYYPQGMFLLAF